jgi:hypothetical protein
MSKEAPAKPDFWEGYVPEPVKPAPVTKDEALDLALEALEYIHEGANNQGPHTGISWRCVAVKAEPAIKAIKQARALDKKAENARELGLDYEPVWNNLPSNKDVEDAMRIKRLNQLTTPPAAPDLQAELDATNRQVEILSDALSESRREVAALAAPVHKPLHPEIKKMYEDFFDKWFRESSAAQRTWVGLTEQERGKVYSDWRWGSNADNLVLCKCIEAKLKEKNT